MRVHTQRLGEQRATVLRPHEAHASSMTCSQRLSSLKKKFVCMLKHSTQTHRKDTGVVHDRERERNRDCTMITQTEQRAQTYRNASWWRPWPVRTEKGWNTRKHMARKLMCAHREEEVRDWTMTTQNMQTCLLAECNWQEPAKAKSDPWLNAPYASQ
jgi:hypothetical protein